MWSQLTQVTTNRKVMTAESERPSFNQKSFSSKWRQPAQEGGYTLNLICSSIHYLSTCCNFIMLTCARHRRISRAVSVQLHKVSAIFHFLLILSPFEIYWCQIYHADRKKSHIFHVFLYVRIKPGLHCLFQFLPPTFTHIADVYLQFCHSLVRQKVTIN